MGQWSYINFIRSQWCTLPPLPTVDMSERTIMVVGANVGLGLETVRHFARMKPKELILACRNKDKGEAAIADIKETTGFQVELLVVDMASFASVSAFASSFTEKHDRLDVLALNAGVLQYHYEATVDGLETNIQVNHLSTMLIALLLLPVMQRTAEQYHTFPHVVITTSVAHFLANTTTDLVNDPAPVARIASKEHSTNRELRERYPLTKMLNMLLVRGLTSRLPPSSPIVVCGVNPGYCHSGLQRHNFFPNTILLWIMEKTLIRGTADGAKTLVHAGISGLPEIERTEREAMRGAYMEDCRPQEPADFLFTQQGETFEGKVWDESVEILARKDPRVRQVVAQYLSRGV